MEVFVSFGYAPVFEKSPYNCGYCESFSFASEFFDVVVGVSEFSEEFSDIFNSIFVIFMIG